MPDFMTIGRTTSGSPARYVGGKYALYVSAMCNGLGLDEWKCEDESASKFPLPTASECEGARAAVLALSVTLGAVFPQKPTETDKQQGSMITYKDCPECGTRPSAKPAG